MKKLLLIILFIVLVWGGIFLYKKWRMSQPCPADDPAGLYTDCKVKTTENQDDPLGIL